MNSININNLKDPINMGKIVSDHIEKKWLDIELIYNSDFKNAKFLRDFIESVWKQFKLDKRQVARFVLVIDELSNNAIEYGSEKGWMNKLRIIVEVDWKKISFIAEVEDTGLWAKPKTALDMETLRAHQLKLWYKLHDSIRWRGLFMIIVNSVDRLYFKDTESWWLIVWIKKTIEV